jgi:hypothetical protein
VSYAAPLMYRPQRRFFSCMTAVATLCCVAPVALGVPGVGLALTPVLLLAGLLLCGRYVGERRILAIRRALLRARRAPRRLPRPAPGRPLVSLLARRARVERGPPRPLAVTI